MGTPSPWGVVHHPREVSVINLLSGVVILSVLTSQMAYWWGSVLPHVGKNVGYTACNPCSCAIVVLSDMMLSLVDA